MGVPVRKPSACYRSGYFGFRFHFIPVAASVARNALRAPYVSLTRASLRLAMQIQLLILFVEFELLFLNVDFRAVGNGVVKPFRIFH